MLKFILIKVKFIQKGRYGPEKENSKEDSPKNWEAWKRDI